LEEINSDLLEADFWPGIVSGQAMQTIPVRSPELDVVMLGKSALR